MQISELKKTTKIYMIGIGGISMSSLAKYLSVNGYTISGSDMQRGDQLDSLAFYGIKVYVGLDENRKELVEADIVVYTDAIAVNHAELLSARQKGKKVYSRGELLALICQDFSTIVAVAGSHGKTTCTSMCAHILKYASVPFMAHIGGEDSLLGNFYYTGHSKDWS